MYPLLILICLFLKKSTISHFIFLEKKKKKTIVKKNIYQYSPNFPVKNGTQDKREKLISVLPSPNNAQIKRPDNTASLSSYAFVVSAACCNNTQFRLVLPSPEFYDGD